MEQYAQTHEPDPLTALYLVDAEQLADAAGDPLKSLALLEQVRWPTGIACPRCGSEDCYLVGRKSQTVRPGLRQCRACSGQFNWRKGTALAKDRNRAEYVVAAVALLKAGASQSEATRRLRIDHELGEARASRLVISISELAPPRPTSPMPAPYMGPEEHLPIVEIEPSASPGPLRLVKEEEGDVEPPSRVLPAPLAIKQGALIGAALVATSVAAALLALLAFTQSQSAEEFTKAWHSGGRKMTWTTPRRIGESMAQWARRHEAELAEARTIYPPDNAR